jgi:hypothetical protein
MCETESPEVIISLIILPIPLNPQSQTFLKSPISNIFNISNISNISLHFHPFYHLSLVDKKRSPVVLIERDQQRLRRGHNVPGAQWTHELAHRKPHQ